ncbi:hypothetical protein B9Z55_028096 [Caenorhabditis nigoni]|uniref:Uncharacterized protein n=1 Tax=Caenorhabditis nigoni TaxID=1611254 RepID=A0A2G5SDL7_9PELO|nr:hypothetical protein B9Z55_028096 [Caenorhabditis nigoni]
MKNKNLTDTDGTATKSQGSKAASSSEIRKSQEPFHNKKPGLRKTICQPSKNRTPILAGKRSKVHIKTPKHREVGSSCRTNHQLPKKARSEF